MTPRTTEEPEGEEGLILPPPPSITLDLYYLLRIPIKLRVARNYTKHRGFRKAKFRYGFAYTHSGSTEYALWLPKIVVGLCVSH